MFSERSYLKREEREIEEAHKVNLWAHTHPHTMHAHTNISLCNSAALSEMIPSVSALATQNGVQQLLKMCHVVLLPLLLAPVCAQGTLAHTFKYRSLLPCNNTPQLLFFPFLLK